MLGLQYSPGAARFGGAGARSVWCRAIWKRWSTEHLDFRVYCGGRDGAAWLSGAQTSCLIAALPGAACQGGTSCAWSCSDQWFLSYGSVR